MNNKWLFLSICLWLSACTPAQLPSNAKEHAAQGSLASTLSLDGRYSLVSTSQHGVALWDNQSHALKYHWHQQQGDNLVLVVAISADNSVALTADDHAFALWNIETGVNIGYWQIKESSIRDAAVSNQGRYVLIGQSDGKVLHIDMTTGRRLEFIAHSERINSVALSANGFYALTGGNDYSAYLWDTRSAQIVQRFTLPSRVTKVTFDNLGRYAFVADSKNNASVYQIPSGQKVSQLQISSRQLIFSSARFSDDGQWLVTGSPTRQINLWQVSNGKKVQDWHVAVRPASRPPSAVVYDAILRDNQVFSESSNGFYEQWTVNTP